MDISGTLESLGESQQKVCYSRLWLEITIAARSIWSDSALADDEKIAALKWLNEVQRRTWHAHADSPGYSPREYAQIVTGHLSQSRAA
jgi:hypothetical protein